MKVIKHVLLTFLNNYDTVYIKNNYRKSTPI